VGIIIAGGFLTIGHSDITIEYGLAVWGRKNFIKIIPKDGNSLINESVIFT